MCLRANADGLHGPRQVVDEGVLNKGDCLIAAPIPIAVEDVCDRPPHQPQLEHFLPVVY